MKRRMAGRLAWGLAGLALAMLVASFLLSLGFDVPEGEVFFLAFFPIFLFGFAATGALIASRQPGNAIGWIFLGTALVWGVAILGTGIAQYAVSGGIPISGLVRFADWVGSWIFLAGIYVPVTFLFLLFPDGRLLSRRWRPVAWISAVAIAGVALGGAFAPGAVQDAVIIRSNPYAFGSQSLWDLVGTFSWFGGIFGMVAGVAALIIRLRRSEGTTRQQLKWLAYTGVVVAILFILTGIGWWLLSDELGSIVTPIITLSALLLIPVAAGVAILRHRLYDIDLVISKTVVYGLLAAFFTLVYVGIVIGIGALIGSRGNPLLSIVATALIALAFQPMRERARRLANRLVYGKRSSPYEVMSEFAERMAGTLSLDEVLPRMARIAAEGTGADRVEVWVRVGNELRLEASWPGESGSRMLQLAADSGLPPIPDVDRVIPVTQQEEVLGAIAVVMPRTEGLTQAGEKLLADLASQAGLVLRNVRLIGELRASRQRLVAAQDAERRRLERNIHDGAQQELVALAVQLRLAEQIASKKAPDMAELLARIKAATQDALDNLRDLARGIYPPLLADKGLAAALESQARKSTVPVEVQPNGIGRYPQEAEAAAYFCVLEALQNIAKYAQASRVTVRLRSENGHLLFSVEDDGRGFDVEAVPRGSGLQNMADRLEALGGRIDIHSEPGAGTTVTGRIPVGA